VPACQSLTVIEYDGNLIPHLRKRVRMLSHPR
jgi:16S rRNA A1518/A1519 N6-dimethyltransferase RsmA/KsgA/DIM1 with predicted DNA glycosylase/AP lyase activity